MGEFIDKEREARKYIPSIEEAFKEGKVQEAKESALRLIQEDPYYLEPYLILHEIYELEGDIRSAEKVLEDALSKAHELLSTEGKMPEKLPWKHSSNRHIINTLITGGVFYWELGELDRALDLLTKVYRMNPEDEPGVRYYILAILEGMSLQEYEQVFVKDGKPDREDLERWFRKHSQSYPEYFPIEGI